MRMISYLMIRSGTSRALKKLPIGALTTAALLLLLTAKTSHGTPNAVPIPQFDVVIYGGTPGGIIAAIASARHGSKVALLESSPFIGGIMVGGLAGTDHGLRKMIGGIAREFFLAVGKHYGNKIGWRFEPKVAKEIFSRMVAAQPGIQLKTNWELDSVIKEQQSIRSIKSLAGDQIQGKVFIDTSYEGDLLAKAKISYRVGRESAAEFKESMAGIYDKRHYFTFPPQAIKAHDDQGNLLPGIYSEPLGQVGAGDKNVPAYNFRFCITNRKENQLPFSKPEGYDPRQYELLGRYMRYHTRHRNLIKLSNIFTLLHLPNDKIDVNNRGAFSTDFIGASREYPEGNRETRRRIFREHELYTKGLVWFLLTDPRIPRIVQRELSRHGYCKDEFVESNNWPHILYIRAARRMVGEYHMTEHDILTSRTKPDVIGNSSTPIESHHVRRYLDPEGFVQNEGYIYPKGERFEQYEIPYRAITPKRSEATNLLVPVALSATHIAYSAIRMEPVFMILGHSAGVAASIAAKRNLPVQDLDISALQQILISERQVLDRHRR